MGHRKVNTICSETRKIAPSRPRMPKRNNQIDFQLLENHITSEKRPLNQQIRYAYYNKGFEMTSIKFDRKFSLVRHELRTNGACMPNIDEYAGSHEDNDDSDNNKWTKSRSADAIHLSNRNKSCYGGSSGRDITLLPRLKIRISDEMGKRIKSSYDDSTSSDENDRSKSFEKRFAMIINNQQLCKHNAAAAAIAFDPFENDVIQTKENFGNCKKCGHKILCKQFSNSF